MTDPAPAAEAAVAADLARIAGGTPEQLADLRGRYHAAAQRAREQLQTIDAAILEHMEALGVTRLAVSDELELRAVTDKTTKCRDKGDTTEALFMALGGDLVEFVECLTADPFKPGRCRTILHPEVWDHCFRTEVKTRLDARLAVVNPKLIPAGSNYERD